MKNPTHTCRMLGALLAMCLFALPTWAAPITFQFQATVGPLPPGNGDIQLPFTLVEGSVIDGLLTIDPDLGEPPFGNGSKSVQPFDITLSFDGFSFGAEMYNTITVNDSAIIDGPNAGPADFIGFSCSASSLDVDCSALSLEFPGSLPLTFSMSATFAGDISLLQQPELPSDIAIWNRFVIERSMTFRFIDPQRNSDSFFTTVSSFSIVPEPPSCAIIGILLMCHLFLRRNFIV